MNARAPLAPTGLDADRQRDARERGERLPRRRRRRSRHQRRPRLDDPVPELAGEA